MKKSIIPGPETNQSELIYGLTMEEVDHVSNGFMHAGH